MGHVEHPGPDTRDEYGIFLNPSDLASHLPGLNPATFGVRSNHASHYTTDDLFGSIKS